MKTLQYDYTRENDDELHRLDEWMSAAGDADRETIMPLMEKIKNEMTRGVCHFTFTKVSGERRDAYGTRLSSVIDRYVETKGGNRPRERRTISGTFPYFDLVRRDWRCFRVDRLMGIDGNYGE